MNDINMILWFSGFSCVISLFTLLMVLVGQHKLDKYMTDFSIASMAIFTLSTILAEELVDFDMSEDGSYTYRTADGKKKTVSL